MKIRETNPDGEEETLDTGLWTPGVLEARARHYDMTVQAYMTKNPLHTEVTSRDAAELCGPLFAKTTAAQIPVDGGNERGV